MHFSFFSLYVYEIEIKIITQIVCIKYLSSKPLEKSDERNTKNKNIKVKNIKMSLRENILLFKTYLAIYPPIIQIWIVLH